MIIPQILLNDLSKDNTYFFEDILLKISPIIKGANFILWEETILFERNFSDYIGCKYWVGTKSWTSALYLWLLALWIWNWDEVITTAMTFNATIEAIVATGATPVFCDIKYSNGNIDEEKIEPLITNKTKAILAVHLYGSSCNNQRLTEICSKYNLYYIEDACQSHWTIQDWKKVWSYWDISCFSFMPAKVLWACWDAWMVLTNKEDIYSKLLLLRNHWRKDKYLHTTFWFNERIDNIQAAILDIKLWKLDSFIHKRRKIAKRYYAKLKFESFFTQEDIKNNNFYVYPIKVNNREELIINLNKLWIKTGVYYPIPNHLQPVFSYLGYKKGDFPVAEKLAATTLAIPMHPFLEDWEIEYVISQLNNNSDYAYR